MNIFLWVLQVLLALHTSVGAVWKFSHSNQVVPSLQVIPRSGWLTLSVIELVWSLCLILPLVAPLTVLAPVAATCIGGEILFFCGVHIYRGFGRVRGPLLYWLAVAAFSAFIVYGRLALQPT